MLKRAKDVLAIEAQAINLLSRRLNRHFVTAVENFPYLIAIQYVISTFYQGYLLQFRN